MYYINPVPLPYMVAKNKVVFTEKYNSDGIKAALFNLFSIPATYIIKKK